MVSLSLLIIIRVLEPYSPLCGILVFVINDVEERMAFAKCRGCRLHSMTGEEIVKEGNRTTTTTTTEKKKRKIYKVLSL